MPEFDAHDEQYRKNLHVIELMQQSEHPPYDWIVTVYFYAALHLVERTLSKHGTHCSDHATRNEKVKSVLFRKITPYYESLYIESQNARYQCAEITVGKVNLAKSHFESIEKYLAV